MVMKTQLLKNAFSNSFGLPFLVVLLCLLLDQTLNKSYGSLKKFENRNFVILLKLNFTLAVGHCKVDFWLIYLYLKFSNIVMFDSVTIVMIMAYVRRHENCIFIKAKS